MFLYRTRDSSIHCQSRYILSPPSESDPLATSRIVEPFLAPVLSKPDEASLGPEEIGLALILLLDQYSRNCFRDFQKNIYNHYDRIARGLLHGLMVRGLDTHDRYREFPAWRL